MDIYEIGFVQCIKDLSNFRKFKKDIKREIQRRDSLFNKYKLQKNWLGNVVYVQIDCSDEDLMNANYDSETMLKMKLSPIVTYLSSELGWGDYLTPQISNFVDEDGNPSLSFGVLFVFSGYRLTFTKAIINILVTLGLFGGGIWALCHFLG